MTKRPLEMNDLNVQLNIYFFTGEVTDSSFFDENLLQQIAWA